MHTSPIPGPFRVENGAVKAVSHGHWYTVALVDKVRFTERGRVAVAEFIARACNAHDELVTALEFYADRDTWKDVETGIGTFPGAAIDYGSRARAALAKAKGVA